MKRILIVNDDGIDSEGLVRLARAAKAFGEVTVVAPLHQNSGVSHSINLHSPIDVYPHAFPVEGVKAYACTGTPGDCVRVGSLNLMEKPPEVVLSGINFGYNVASDMQYSATVGGAFEGAFQGALSIALSESDRSHAVTDVMLSEVLSRLLETKLPDGEIYNVNFPGCSMEEYKGILEDRTVSKGMIYKDHYNMIEKLENGGMRFMVEGEYHEEAEEGSDYRAVLDGYISISRVNNVGIQTHELPTTD